MDMFRKLTKKFAKTASTAVTDEVKSTVKETAINILPALIGLGFVVISLKVFKTSAVKLPISSVGILPTISSMSVVTNNFFLGEDVGKDIAKQLADKALGK